MKKYYECENCKQNFPYDLANKGIYNRDLRNWKWLCRRCHMLEDGRLTSFYLKAPHRLIKRIARICNFCNSNFSIVPSRLKRGKGEGKYCSWNCYLGGR